jgi:hypothetical protein
VVELVSSEYKNRNAGEDKFFKAIPQIIGEGQITCDAEILAQTLAARNKVYRYTETRINLT